MARPRGSAKQREKEARLLLGGGKLLGYVRVSTNGQAENGHSLDGQRTRLEAAAETHGFELLEIIEDVESGTKDRDGLNEVQARIDAGEAEGILFTALDRLGRSSIALGTFIRWAKDNGVTLLSSDQGMMVERGESKNPAIPILVGVAEMERDRISARTREGLAAAKAKGVELGCPIRRPTDDPLVKRAVRLRKKGHSLQAIADRFNSEGLTSVTGKEFSPTAIWRYVQRANPKANPLGGYGDKTKTAKRSKKKGAK